MRAVSLALLIVLIALPPSARAGGSGRSTVTFSFIDFNCAQMLRDLVARARPLPGEGSAATGVVDATHCSVTFELDPGFYEIDMETPTQIAAPVVAVLPRSRV